MTLVDTNVWVALALSGHSLHTTAREWFKAEPPAATLLFCRYTQQSFLRLLTTEAVFKPFGDPPLTNAEAWEVCQGYLADPRIGFAREPEGLESLWHRMAAQESASPKAWMDAYLAAFALAGGHRFATLDGAFTKYTGLDLILITQQ